MPVLLALALLALVQTPAPPDTTDAPARAASAPGTAPASAAGRAAGGGRGDETGVEVRPRFAPSALYSADYGFGIGGGVGVGNLAGAGTDLAVDLLLQQHYQGADVAFWTSAPYVRSVYGLVAAGASTTDRRYYAGLAPAARPASAVDLEHSAVYAELRAGAFPLRTTALYVQPSVRLHLDRSSGLADDSRGSLAAFDPASRGAVETARGDRTGVSAGLEVGTDLRDWPGYPRRGVQASAEHRRFFALSGSDLTLARTSGSVVGYLPVFDRGAVILRAVAGVTRSGDADGDGRPDPVPFYDLPTLDDQLATPFRRNRLTGRDVVAIGAGVRAPLADVLGLLGVDAVVMGYLGNAYDDVFDQFRPAISFRDNGSVDGEGRAALRPALSVGLGLVDLAGGRTVLGASVGLAPGGVTLATLRVAYDLRDVGLGAR